MSASKTSVRSVNRQKRIEATRDRIEALERDKARVMAQYDKRIALAKKLLADLDSKETLLPALDDKASGLKPRDNKEKGSC